MYEFLWRLPPTLYLAIQQTFRSGNKVLSLFSIIGITVSVALAVGLESASRSVDAELDRTSAALSGRANLHVTAGSAGIPDSMVAELRAVPGVETASLLMIASLWLDDGTALHVVGVDFFADQKVHQYSIRERGVEVRDSLRLVSLPDSVVITRALSERLGLGLGDRLAANSTTGPIELVVRGILEPGGIADAYGGQVAAMDVYGLQLLVGREGLVDRIDIVAAAGAVDRVAEELRRRTAGIAEVSPSSSDAALAGVIEALRSGVLLVVLIGVAVAGFISYTTTAMSADRRLRELALLQLAGVGPRGVRTLILAESVVVGMLAVAIGTPLGGLASDLIL
ncbi:MAG: hypothetical protein JRG82_16495, partial [Deltaproteobacteria bacterium]|nr:hypothetical protein [Deltaproteobacteria bacterium]